MADAGIDDETIISTLKDTGMDEAGAKAALAQVKNPAASTAPEMPAEVHPAVTEQINNVKTEVATQAEALELHATTTQNVLDMQNNKIDDVVAQVQEVKQIVASPSASSAGAGQGLSSSADYRLSEMQKKVDETNAGMNACLDLMKKILETDRKILVELESKK